MEEYKKLSDLVKLNTIKDKENKEIINYIEADLIKQGFKTENKGKYLIMSIGKKQVLGFLGHTDTVEYIAGWKTNPLELTKIENKLYGLGVCDMKGGIAAILDAISEINFKQLKHGIKLYFTYDEEIGFGGIYDLIKANEKFPPIMIFGEPTDNELLIGSKGLLEYEIYFKGKKAHSSNPSKGKSANLNAIKFLNELNDFYQNKIKSFEEAMYEVPYTTMNIGLINGGSSKNSVSANCDVSIDFRIANKKHIDIIKKEIELLSNKYECTINIIECIEPFINTIDFIEEIRTANFITEASLINDCKRIILGVGPVTAHEVNEYIAEDSYKKLVLQYKKLIEEVCDK